MCKNSFALLRTLCLCSDFLSLDCTAKVGIIWTRFLIWKVWTVVLKNKEALSGFPYMESAVCICMTGC